MKKVLLPLCLFSFGTLAQQHHELNVGFNDLKDRDDSFIGVQYRYYLEGIEDDDTPLLISPYLQRISSVSGQYFSINDTSLYNIGTVWYIDNQWMLAVDGTYIDRDHVGFESSDKALDVKVGYNVTPNWQVGVGAFYRRDEYFQSSYTGVNDRVEVEVSPGAFARYTQISHGQGWDVSAELSSGEIDTFNLKGSYFFSKQLSVGAGYTHLSAERGVDQDVIDVEVDYWFTNGLSLSAGLGVNVGDENGLGSASLLATYRF